MLLTAVAGDLIEADWTKARQSGAASRMPKTLPLILQKPADDAALNDALARAGRNAAYWPGKAASSEADADEAGARVELEGADRPNSAAGATPEPNEAVKGV